MNQLLRHLRISDLELFVAAARLKNLGKAAQGHNLSQSAASAAIQRVEAGFGQSLCLHEKRQFGLTYEGSELVLRIETWLKEFRETVAPEIQRPVRLVTTRAIARVIIPALLEIESIELQLKRPDRAYAAVLRNTADIALVPANAAWADVHSVEVGAGSFQLYSALSDAPLGPVLLPENQIEVLSLVQRWEQRYKKPLEIKARIPSWSLIADICAGSADIGFLPDFLAKKAGLHPVSWQPQVSEYRILALHNGTVEGNFYQRLMCVVEQCTRVFSGE